MTSRRMTGLEKSSRRTGYTSSIRVFLKEDTVLKNIRPEAQFVMHAPRSQGARRRSQVRVVRQDACSVEGAHDDDP